MSAIQISHVIFDLDGLLLDTEGIYTRIFESIASRYGKEFTYQLKWKQMGKSMKEAAAIFIDELQIPMTIEEYCLEVPKLINLQMADALLMPGAYKLINHLRNCNIEMAIATGSSNDEYLMKTKKHAQLFEAFENVVCTTGNPEVKRGKPHPDVFLLALSKFKQKVSPDNVLVFEDAPNGVEAAIAAGMRVVWVPSRPLLDEINKNPANFPKADFILESLEHFVPESCLLPKF